MTSNYVCAKSFSLAAAYLRRRFYNEAIIVDSGHWQGRSTKNKPDLVTHELLNVTVHVPLSLLPSGLDYWRGDIKPHLPWADHHFEERVGGEPLNPGNTWHMWRHAASASSFLEGQKRQFNHTYMERFWPKYAGMTDGGLRTKEFYGAPGDANQGIRLPYGDLNDLVGLLVKEPHTRQAYLPIFFPEDTGIADGGRKPCTLGYQFIMRDKQLHCYYPMRSCDFENHWADDCYLAIRLMLWIIDQCMSHDPESVWQEVRLGSFTMHCTSLHLFRNDFLKLCRRENVNDVP